MTGVERIRLAAQECADPNSIAGPTKIRLAAAECRDPNPLPGPEKIRRAALNGEKLGDESAGIRKIRAATGLPVDETESLAKALAMSSEMEALDSLVVDLGRLLKASAPARRPPPSRAPRPQPARPAPVPSPGRVAESRPLRFNDALGYWDFRDRLAGDIRAGHVHPTAERIVRHAATNYGIGTAEAAEWTERFLGHLRRALPAASAAARML